MKSVDDAIAGACNIQAGAKVYPMNFGTSDIDGIKLALEEEGYMVVPRWLLILSLVGVFGMGYILG